MSATRVRSRNRLRPIVQITIRSRTVDRGPGTAVPGHHRRAADVKTTAPRRRPLTYRAPLRPATDVIDHPSLPAPWVEHAVVRSGVSAPAVERLMTNPST